MIAAQDHHQLATSLPDVTAAHPGPTNGRPGVVARVAYSTSYCLSFSVVFPTLLAASLIPTRNAMGYGLLDGARAAIGAQRRVQSRAAAAVSTTTAKVGDTYAGVAARVSRRVEAIEDAIAEKRYRRRIATT